MMLVPMSKRAVITGAFSYTGAAAAAELLARGWRVHTLSNRHGPSDSPLSASPLRFERGAGIYCRNDLQCRSCARVFLPYHLPVSSRRHKRCRGDHHRNGRNVEYRHPHGWEWPGALSLGNRCRRSRWWQQRGLDRRHFLEPREANLHLHERDMRLLGGDDRAIRHDTTSVYSFRQYHRVRQWQRPDGLLRVRDDPDRPRSGSRLAECYVHQHRIQALTDKSDGATTPPAVP